MEANCIWRLKVPERIRVFLWLVSQQAIMTNEERFRRHIGVSNVCQVCRGGVESIINVLRDCPAMQGIWDRIIPRVKSKVSFGSLCLNGLMITFRARRLKLRRVLG